MSYEKMMKRCKPGKYKKQPMLFHAEGFTGAKSVWADQKKCPVCQCCRPTVFFVDGKCDVCNNKNNGG